MVGKHFGLVAAVLGILSIPIVYASTGVGMMDNVLNMIGNFFNISAFENELVQIGFLRIGLFIIMFTIAYYSLKRAAVLGENGGKPAKVIAFVFAAIAAFMMPTPWLLATGGTITFVMSSLIFVLLFWGLAWVAIKELRGDWIKNLFGLLLLIMLSMLIVQWAIMVDVGGQFGSSQSRGSVGYAVPAPAQPTPQSIPSEPPVQQQPEPTSEPPPQALPDENTPPPILIWDDNDPV